MDDTTTKSVEALRDDLRTAWHRFVDLLVPIRPLLHGHCRRLTRNVFDAEDLLQETLLRAFGRWGVSCGEVRDPKAYLLRTATHLLCGSAIAATVVPPRLLLHDRREQNWCWRAGRLQLTRRPHPAVVCRLRYW